MKHRLQVAAVALTVVVRTLSLGLAAALAAVVVAPAAAVACTEPGEEMCRIADGAYRIALPDGVERPAAVVWLHGWGGSADGVMRNRGMLDLLERRGYALIAPDGIVTSPERNDNKNWAVRDGQEYARDDVVFLSQVVEDAAERHGVDRERILLAGFSRGGSMVWDAACRAPEMARAYAPLAGAFWEPMPEGCGGPVDLYHVHGWADRTVPLEGRPLRGGALVQGDVFESLKILRETNGCTGRQPEATPVDEAEHVWRRSWSDCRGGRIDLSLHPGGHAIPAGWLKGALDWFEDRLAEDCADQTAAAEAVERLC